MATFGTCVRRAGHEQAFDDYMNQPGVFRFIPFPERSASDEQEAIEIALENFEEMNHQHLLIDEESMDAYEITISWTDQWTGEEVVEVIGWEVEATGHENDLYPS